MRSLLSSLAVARDQEDASPSAKKGCNGRAFFPPVKAAQEGGASLPRKELTHARQPEGRRRKKDNNIAKFVAEDVEVLAQLLFVGTHF